MKYFPVSHKCFAAFEPALAVTTTVCLEKRRGTEITATVMQGEIKVDLKKL
jgi:hypothetical protein